MTSACTYFSSDTTEHVLRPHSAHTRWQAHTHAAQGDGVHLCSCVCAIINTAEIARQQTRCSEYQRAEQQRREGERRAHGAQHRGIPTGFPQSLLQGLSLQHVTDPKPQQVNKSLNSKKQLEAQNKPETALEEFGSLTIHNLNM